MLTKISRTIAGRLLLAAVVGGATETWSDPPRPAPGTRWVLQPSCSDEFTGMTLDTAKWRNGFEGWAGRSPAKFVPSTVGLAGGFLRVRNGVLNPPQGDYNIAGGAVQTKKCQALPGYYESRFKASRISMSTTFWLSTNKHKIPHATKLSGGTDCPLDRFSQELDVVESIGGVISGTDKFRTQMNFNTHYRYIDCAGSPEKFYSAGNNAIEGTGTTANAKLPSESWEDFHTYGVEWRSATEFDFYANGTFAGRVKANTSVVDTPFTKPMRINLVTETYNWAKPYPTTAQLNDTTINTSTYDWVRSWTSLQAKQAPPSGSVPAIFTETVLVDGAPKVSTSRNALEILVIWKANRNRSLRATLSPSVAGSATSNTVEVFAGYGADTVRIAGVNALAKGTWNLVVESLDSTGKLMAKSASIPVSLAGGSVETMPRSPSSLRLSFQAGEIVLDGGHNASLQVLDARGTPVATLELRDGRARLEGIPAGVYTIRSRVGGIASSPLRIAVMP